MKIFADYHHKGLAESLKMLLEGRLGHELYFPHGIGWFNEGYWNIAKPYNDFPGTIHQYLEAPTDERTATYEDFKDFDVVIASYYGNIEPYRDLAQKFGCKFVTHHGNEWPVDWNITRNLMSSTIPVKVPNDRRAVFYYQEFDTVNYHIADMPPEKVCRSFVHLLATSDLYRQDWEDFNKLKSVMTEYDIESYGIGCPKGKIIHPHLLAEAMRECEWGIHFKSGGDGFGHVIHSWFAVTRPVIYKGSQYKDRLAGKLLEHGVTGIDAERVGIENVPSAIKSVDYEVMLKNVGDRFDDVVNFDKDAKKVKKFLEELI